jgi:2-dehydro-3-deoxyphosphogluconate aldolase/(4S)-4-hydroxy-2-oxoglutarate aldolase
MNYTRIYVASEMSRTGLVPLFYHNDLNVCIEVLKACYNGGARLLEFTHRGNFAHELFSELSKYCTTHLPGMILGVGSITDAAAASHYMMLGAGFVVTPVLREDIAVVCNRRKVLWSPGCGSLSEIAKAEELGAEIIKLFPGSQLGPGFVKAIKGPCPWTSLMPTGGVTTSEDNLKSWFDAGVTCVGIGSELISKQVLESGDYTALEQKVRTTLNTIESIRST